MVETSYEISYKHVGRRFNLVVELDSAGNISVARLDGLPADNRTPHLLQEVKDAVNSEIPLPKISIMLQRNTFKLPHKEKEFIMKIAKDLERFRSAAVSAVRKA